MVSSRLQALSKQGDPDYPHKKEHLTQTGNKCKFKREENKVHSNIDVRLPESSVKHKTIVPKRGRKRNPK